jgi:putative tricarboxylic transport membrane protein
MAEWLLAFSTLIGAGVYLHAAQDIPSLMLGDVVGPRFFPELVGIGLMIAGLLLMYETWRKHSRFGEAADGANVEKSKKAQKIILCALLWTIVYYAAFEPVGYIISTIVYIFCLLCYFNRVKWWHNAIYTVMFTGVAYAIFDKFLNVVLPSGLLPV